MLLNKMFIWADSTAHFHILAKSLRKTKPKVIMYWTTKTPSKYMELKGSTEKHPRVGFGFPFNWMTKWHKFSDLVNWSGYVVI